MTSGAASGVERLARPRDEVIDALRAWCLLGIAVVNVPWIGFEAPLPDLLWDPARRAALSPLDLAAAALVEGLFEGKFYPQFAALFGFGAASLLAKGGGPFSRRIAALFVFGVLHAIFGWWGDILLDYALVGVILAALHRLPNRGVLATAVLVMLATLAVSIRYDDWFAPDASDPARWAEHAAHLAQETAVYRDGDFATITRHRIEELSQFFATTNWSYRLNTVAMGAFGLWIGKTGGVERLVASPRHGTIALGLVVAGLVASASLVLVPSLYIPAGNLLALGYAAGFLWLARRPTARKVIGWLAPLGRASISAYLGQTIVFTFFFYGYGLAMYGRLGPAEGVLLAVVVWSAEVALARFWLLRFAYGPVEWLWRSVTYGRLLPWRVED